MAGDSGRRSGGITAEQTMLALAGSFRFGNCVVRGRLAAIASAPSAAARWPA